MRTLRSVAILLTATMIASDTGSTGEYEPAAVESASAALEEYVALIEELDMRRRVNVLFPNPQSLFDGLHVGFVNVTAGNLTFRRRDVVTNADGPVVFARVYDSRIAANPDFGPGWRLSLAEELVVDEAGLTHVDRSGARHRFSADGHGYVADPPTPRHAGTRVTVSADGAVMREGDGTVRVFRRSADGGTFRIAKVEAAGRRLDFGYVDGLLATISRDGRMLFDIRRGGDGGGLIAAVTDGHERTVSYSYARGLLKDVADLAGNVWWHEYDRDGRLTAAVGANRKPYLRVSYDARGRVVESLTGREYAYDYSRRRTTVTEGSGQRHAFERDAAGVTVALRSSNGTRWRIGLDRENRVEILETPDRTVVYGYDADGAVESAAETTDAGTVRREYRYDGEGRLTEVRSSAAGERLDVDYATRHVRLTGDGSHFSFELSRDGEVSRLRDGDVVYDAERDRAGDLTALREGGRAVFFSRDAFGRITDAAYPDGTANRYFHDALGNRTRVEFGAGGAARYRHDAAGNIVQVDVTELDGSTKRQTVTIGDMNRVARIDYEGSHTLRVDYDRMGRPVAFATGEDTVTAEYTALGRLARLSSAATGEVSAFGDDGLAVGSPGKADRRRAALSGDVVGEAQPGYGAVGIAETTFEAVPRDPVEAGVPGLAAARALAAVAGPLFADESAGMADFEKPSNPVFQPPEYRSTNCCMPFACEFCAPTGGFCYGGGNKCSDEHIDSAAKMELMSYQREPFERGFTMVCQVNERSGDLEIAVVYPVNSNPRANEDNDPCAVELIVTANAVGYAHSHPFFANHGQMEEGRGCLRKKSWTFREDERANMTNRHFSDKDKDFAKRRDRPLYLITPLRDQVKVYRKDSSGRWRTVIVD